MSASSHRVVRLGRDVRALAATLEPDEPRTTKVISDLLTRDERRHRRAWRIDGSEGELAGVVVLTRACFDRWAASAHLRAPEAAPVVAQLLDRSVAWNVQGAAADIRPLLPHLSRRRNVLVAPWFTAAHPIPDVVGEPDDRTRLATRLDLDALVELYSGYESTWPLTRWQLRAYLQQRLERHLVFVCEIDGLLVGAALNDGRTRRYATFSDLTVHPDFRRAGIAWELVKRARVVDVGLGVGASGVVSPSNPMHRDHEGVVWDDEHYYAVSMGAPRRFKGQTRLRRLYHRVQPITPRAPTLFRDPADPSRPPA